MTIPEKLFILKNKLARLSAIKNKTPQDIVDIDRVRLKIKELGFAQSVDSEGYMPMRAI